MTTYFRGRQARPASRRWNIFKTLAQMVIFWSAFLALLPAVVFALETELGWGGLRFASPAARWAGGAVFCAGGALGLTSSLVMAVRGRGTPLPADCPRELVLVGPYRYVRNPMAIAGLSQGVGVGLVLGSPAVIGLVLLGGPVWHLFVRPWEEDDLEQRFGPPYQQYRRAVWCWLPRRTGYRPAGELAGPDPCPPA